MTADLIITNGRVLTMDVAAPEAEAVAIAGNTIIAVGRADTLKGFAGPATRIIDAAGATVMPGFIEAHMHLFEGAGELANLNLTGVHGFEAMAAAVTSYAASKPGDDLLVVNQCDYAIISPDEPLTRHHLDRMVADRPLFVYAPDHHTAWVNTVALERAGILGGKALGPGNEIVMAGDGLATGELREKEAMAPVMALSAAGDRTRLGLTTGGEPDPPPTPEQFEHDLAIMARGLAHAARHGITSIHNMDGNFYTLELLAELERRGGLTARVRVPFHYLNFMSLADLDKASAMAQRYRSEMLSSGFVKVFMDGVIEGATAYLVDDYADQQGWRGEPLFSREAFAAVACAADARGLQIAVHAIGDAAVRTVLDGYEAARKANGSRDSRHRIEHIELIQQADIGRLVDLGVVASMQPPHAPGAHDVPLQPFLARIGEARWPLAMAWRTIRAAGARMVFATDWPVSDINPLRAIKAAMTRPAWKDGLPDQRQGLMECLRSYTHDGAYVEFMEHRKGMLREGMLADVVVLSADLTRCEPAGLDTVRPLFTIVNGRVVFEG